MRINRFFKVIILSFSSSLLVGADFTSSLEKPRAIEEVFFEQKLGHQLPRELSFKDEFGNQTNLAFFFQNKPVLLVLAYYRCANLCTLVLNGLVETLNHLESQLGKDYEVITLSIDPKETPSLALAKRRSYLARYQKAHGPLPWHFLTGDENSIKKLAEAIGFRYRYDPLSQTFSHPAGFLVLSPSAKIIRYFFGIRFDPKEVQKEILDAKREKAGSITSSFLLSCFHYNPLRGRYGVVIITALKMVAVLFVIAGLLAILRLFKKEELSA